MLKRLLAASLALIMLLPLLAGCSATRVDPLAYTARAFSANVRGKYCRTSPDGRGDAGVVTEISGVISVDPTTGASCVTFLSPDTLSGIEARRGADGNVTVQRGNLTLAGDAFCGLLRLADSLLPTGDVVSVTPVRNGVYTATVRSADAETTLDFTEGDALPSHLRMSDGYGWVELYIDEKTP